MDRDDNNGMGPEDGARAMLDVIGQVAEIGENGDLADFEAVFRKMEQIVADSGTEVPGIDEKIDMLRQMTALQQGNLDQMDAALWAGDFARAEAMMADVGCGPDLLGAFEDEAFADDTLEDDADDGTVEVELAFDAADLAQLLGGGAADAASEDIYADLAAGAPGAAEALIAAGIDLNTPCGEAMHTAILAALDAPGRRAATIAALIDAGADAQVIHGQVGDNVFSWSMGYHHPDTITEESELGLFAVLASEGADPDYLVPGQMAALHRGILQGSTPQVEAILTIGADPDQCLPAMFEPAKLAGATPLMLAAPKPDLVQRLLDHGADAERLDADGRDQLTFLVREAKAARDRATPEDAWTVAHADALEHSVAILRAHLGHVS